MKTHIQLGIVVKIAEHTIQELEHILDVVEIYHQSVLINHPVDGDYSDWKEEIVEGDLYSMIDKLSYREAYAKIKFDINDNIFDTVMKTTHEGDDIIVSFDVKMDDLSLEIVELDELLQNVFDVFDRNVEVYEYMYCDNEAEYLYSKDRLLELGFIPYSILKFSGRESVLAAWHVDGKTLRILD